MLGACSWLMWLGDLSSRPLGLAAGAAAAASGRGGAVPRSWRRGPALPGRAECSPWETQPGETTTGLPGQGWTPGPRARSGGGAGPLPQRLCAGRGGRVD